MEEGYDYSLNTNLDDPNSLIPKKRSNNKIWLFIIIPFLIIIIGIIIFLFFILSTKPLSEDKINIGTTIRLKESKLTKFVLDDEIHTIKINSVKEDSISLTLESKPIRFNIKLGETKKLDINQDDYYDIEFKLNKIEKGVPEIYIKKIRESINPETNSEQISTNANQDCIENWNCTNWSSCINGEQIRNCIDLNECGTITEKPFFKRKCTNQQENFEGCEEFGIKINCSQKSIESVWDIIFKESSKEIIIVPNDSNQLGLEYCASYKSIGDELLILEITLSNTIYSSEIRATQGKVSEDSINAIKEVNGTNEFYKILRLINAKEKEISSIDSAKIEFDNTFKISSEDWKEFKNQYNTTFYYFGIEPMTSFYIPDYSTVNPPPKRVETGKVYQLMDLKEYKLNLFCFE